MSFSKTFGSGWELSIQPLGDQIIARLWRGEEAYELITRDATMMGLADLGYRVTVDLDMSGEPWVSWLSPADGSRFVWVCPHGAAMWAKSVMGDKRH